MPHDIQDTIETIHWLVQHGKELWHWLLLLVVLHFFLLIRIYWRE